MIGGLSAVAVLFFMFMSHSKTKAATAPALAINMSGGYGGYPPSVSPWAASLNVLPHGLYSTPSWSSYQAGSGGTPATSGGNSSAYMGSGPPKFPLFGYAVSTGVSQGIGQLESSLMSMMQAPSNPSNSFPKSWAFG